MNIRTISTVFAAVALSACASATPYQPLTKGEGYREQRLETNRYRVTYSGNTATPRETVENYMMYRAAEITLQNGYDWFVLASRTTRDDPQRSRQSGSVGLGVGGGSGNFGSGVSIGLGTIFGGGKGPAYDAQADILVFKGEKPAPPLAPFDAREVKANLESQIRRKPAAAQ